ncbi:MAG TPA: RNA methyltransferase [Acidimicrobiales bacterium]|nr:RNA methyltransferase [Acidimicrobiales bacterium]
MYASDARTDGLCIVEGRLSIEVLLDSPYEPVSLLVAERLAQDPLVAVFPGDVIVASQAVIDDTVGFNMHRGMAACARRGEPRTIDDVTREARTLLVVECVNDPENLGALFRNAAAFGVDGVILDPTTCDALSRRVIRVSMGHALRVPFARGPIPPLDGFTTVALTPDADVDVADVRASRVALFVGNEGNGLSDALLHAADVRAAIPMAKGVDSLNVATAAAVALALLRRRD